METSMAWSNAFAVMANVLNRTYQHAQVTDYAEPWIQDRASQIGHVNFQITMNVYAGLDAEQMCESGLQLGTEYAKIAGKSCRKMLL